MASLTAVPAPSPSTCCTAIPGSAVNSAQWMTGSAQGRP